MREFFADIYAFDFANENLRAFRSLDACQLRNLEGTLANDFRVQRAVYYYCFADLFSLSLVEEIAAAVGKFFFNLVLDGSYRNHRLF